MRAERLAWADTSDAPARNAPAAIAPTSPPANAKRRRLLHRGAVRGLARAVDAIVVLLITSGLCLSAGIDIWLTPLGAALPFLLMPPAIVAGVSIAGGYRLRYDESLTGHLLRTALGASAIMGSLALIAFVAGSANLALFERLAAANALAVVALHANLLNFLRAAMRNGLLSDNVVIVGATQAAARIVSRNVRECDLNIIGYFDDRADKASVTLMGDTPFLGGIDDLLAWERLPEVDRIVITVTSTAQQRVRDLVNRLRNLPHEIILVLDLDGFNPEQTSLASVVDAPAAYISGAPKDVHRAILKRAFDVVVGTISLIVLAPVLATVALLVKLDSRGPTLVRHKRYGFNNEIIDAWHFRTAQDGSVTRAGRWLRAAGLDELPQLINVLKGDLSIVGPRPHAVDMTARDFEVHRALRDYAHRHRMKPGMTGWAQVNSAPGAAHAAEEVRRRVALDMHYVSRASMWFDAWIVLLTVPRVLLAGQSRHR